MHTPTKTTKNTFPTEPHTYIKNLKTVTISELIFPDLLFQPHVRIIDQINANDANTAILIQILLICVSNSIVKITLNDGVIVAVRSEVADINS